MILIPIVGTIGIVAAVFFCLDSFDNLVSRILAHIVVVPIFGAIGIITGVLVAAIVGIIGFVFPTEEVTISETPIYSLVDQSQYSGSFVLGTGSVEGDLGIYYVEQTDSGKRIAKVDREKVIIVESDTEQPSARIHGERYKFECVNWFFLDPHPYFDKTILTVPTNTITTEYRIDLK